MKRFFILYIVLLAVFNLYAQPKLTFEKTFNHLGTLNWEDKSVECKVKYYNTGDKPLYLTNATCSCYCTTADYSNLALAPGDSTYLTITHTFRNIGGFEYSVKFFYHKDDEEDDYVYVTVAGMVNEKDKSGGD